MLKKIIYFAFTLALTSQLTAQIVLEESLVAKSIYTGSFIVGGDANTYYPVTFRRGGSQVKINHIKIYRRHLDPAPSSLLSPQGRHCGGLLLEIETNYGARGGISYDWRVTNLRQKYHETFANAQHDMYNFGFTVWLRGGGFVYNYESEKPADIIVGYEGTVIYENPFRETDRTEALPPLTEVNWENINKHLLGHKDNLIGTTTAAENGQSIAEQAYGYKQIDMQTDGKGSYSKSVILLHEMYDNVKLGSNFVIGKIEARRGGVGSLHRMNIVEINSGSAYTSTHGEIVSYTSEAPWKFVTVYHEDIKYLAVVVPYKAAQNTSFHFSGRAVSTAKSLQFVVYEDNGDIVDQKIAETMEDFNSNLKEHHTSWRVTYDGKVGIGIGDQTPDAQLAVKGGIHTDEVTIDLEGTVGPDYVFDSNYDLKSLEEVQEYIQENKHLPNIPSAAELEEKGLNVMEMNLKLLEKVEELTLHLIEQNNRLKTLEVNNGDLEKSNKDLRKLIEEL